MDKIQNNKVFNKLMIISFLGYALILLGERITALVLSIHKGGIFALTSKSFIGISTYAVTLISVIAFLVIMIKPLLRMASTLFSKNLYDFESHYKVIILGSTVFLFSGMMHTGFTLIFLQFVAYGLLIMGMIVSCISYCLSNKSVRYVSIVSTIYLTLFSMAIPVVYNIHASTLVTTFYYLAEYIAVFLLVPTFGKSLYKLLANGKLSFCVYVPLLMVILDTLIIILKWKESHNGFLMTFMVATSLFYLSFGLVAIHKNKRLANG